jgi:hypothetical protein
VMFTQSGNSYPKVIIFSLGYIEQRTWPMISLDSLFDF